MHASRCIAQNARESPPEGGLRTDQTNLGTLDSGRSQRQHTGGATAPRLHTARSTDLLILPIAALPAAAKWPHEVAPRV